MSKRKRRGLTLIELIVVLVILVLVSSFSLGVGNAFVNEGKIRLAKAELEKMSDIMTGAVYDIGYLTSEDIKDTSKRQEYFEGLNQSGISMSLDLLNLKYIEHSSEPTPEGFCFGESYDVVVIDTIKAPDPWGEEYRMYYEIDVNTNESRVVFASSGVDREFDESAFEGYIGKMEEDDVGDDLILIIDSFPRI